MIRPSPTAQRARVAAGLLARLLTAYALSSVGTDAHAMRVAILAGNDAGHSGDAPLRFAESDVARFQDLLVRIGGFSSTVLQRGRSADELRRVLTDVAERLRTTPGDHLVLLFYSGHADAQALHMGTSSFPLAELQAALLALPASTRVLILDACQAGVLTRAKGGSPGSGFAIPLAPPRDPEGVAILAASAGSELAQESDQLGGSVFTHHLQAGLAGLADRNRDGAVSLGEAFDYASQRTLATTFGTSTGPQHPTFRLDITGRDDLILTRPGAVGVGYGRLRVDVPGWYLIRRGDGTLAAEVIGSGNETLVLDPGTYEVTRRETGGLDVGNASLTADHLTSVSEVPMYPVAFGRMVRKGGGPEAAFSLALATATRTGVVALGPSFGGALTGRADLSVLSLEARLGLGRAHQDATRLSSTTWEGSLSVALLRPHDFASPGHPRLPTLAYGLEAGLSSWHQTVDVGETHRALSPFAGPSSTIEHSMGHRLFLRGEVDLRIYLMKATDGTGETMGLHPSLLASFGAGGWF